MIEIFKLKNDKDQFERMTTAPIPALIVSLAIPTIASMLVTALYNTADTFFVSQLGTSASGAVGIVFSLMAIFQAIGFTLGMGAGTIISRKLGARDIEAAGRTASTSFFTAMGCGFILLAVGMMELDRLMLLLGATPTILPFAKDYATYILFGAPIMCTSFVMNNILRSEGKAVLAMTGLVTGGFINIILDPIFIFTLGFGISGAAIATLISQCISFSILFSFFLRRKSTARVHPSLISRDIRDYTEIVRCGFPSLCRQGLASFSTVMLNVSAAAYGDAAIAAMSIVARVFMFIFSVILGLGQGFMPVAGFNYGARNYRKVREAFWFTTKLGSVLMVILGGIGIAFAPEIISLFRDDPAVISAGTLPMRLQCLAIMLYPFFVSTNMLLQTTGQAGRATFLACNRQGIIFLPLIFFLPRFFGLAGVQTAQSIADLLNFLVSIPFLCCFMKELKELEAYGAQSN